MWKLIITGDNPELKNRPADIFYDTGNPADMCCNANTESDMFYDPVNPTFL